MGLRTHEWHVDVEPVTLHEDGTVAACNDERAIAWRIVARRVTISTSDISDEEKEICFSRNKTMAYTLAALIANIMYPNG